MARKYFGTDGMRGTAGRFPLDGPTLRALGAAAGRVLGGRGASALLGSDTRLSGPSIMGSLAYGLSWAGVSCRSAGVIPTPGVAHLVRGGFTFGAVVTASHNPFEDNGVKFFSGDGFKLPDEEEEAIEAELDRILRDGGEEIPESGAPAPNPALLRAYRDHLLASWSGPALGGLKVVLDCAHGASTLLAPQVFGSLGAEVIGLGCSPDGTNINLGCGSLHAGGLIRTVAQSGAFAGFAFDGDADRCLAVTPSGQILDGDYLLYHEALRRRAAGSLGGGVVGTAMSNLWVEKAFRGAHIPFHRAAVGDRYVLQELQARRWTLGGEPSGHILFLDRATTGDGLLTALTYASLDVRDAGGMEALAAGIRPFPQVLRNLKVARRVDLKSDGEVVRSLAREEKILGERGRIVLRFSGTEPLLRVMVEAEEMALVDGALDSLSAFLEGYLGKG